MTYAHKPLHRQVIVITGASSGIGLATARMAAERGARVVLAARNGDVLADICGAIEAAGGSAVYVAADVGRREDVQAIANKAVAAFGGFDTWVNVAGLTIYGELREVSDADSDRLMRTNFWGTVYGSLVAVEHLAERGGALINVGSIASDLAFPFQGMYCASKHAVKGFTDALRMELKQAGAPISVSLVKPASIDSPLPQHARNYMNREPKLPPPVYRPEEVAHAILHAAVRPQRDIFVGGGGKAFVALKQFAPGAYDLLGPVITLLQRRSDAPRDPAGSLYRPNRDGRERGIHPGYVARTSLYTRASLHPAGIATLAALSLAGLAVAILREGRPRRRR